MAVAIKIEATKGADHARVVSLVVQSGNTVEAGQLLFEVENHKVVQEIDAPCAGTLVHALSEGDLIFLGAPFAFLIDSGENAANFETESCKAIALSANVAPLGTSVSVAKATEIAVLGSGAGNSLLASLGAKLGAVRRAAATQNFFQDKILDLMVYESARLLKLKKYRKLNAYFADGEIIEHDEVRAGISFDEGGRLTVYALRDAEKLSLNALQEEIVAGLMRYVGRQLSLDDVATATYTISDVTSAPLAFSVPLLPHGQAFIIVVTRDEAGDFMLSVSYDHRVTEGLLVTSFLQELILRIRSYSTPLPEPACAYCNRSAQTEMKEFKRRGLMKMVNSDGAEELCCSTCWEMW